jgi:hypothetical protein
MYSVCSLLFNYGNFCSTVPTLYMRKNYSKCGGFSYTENHCCQNFWASNSLGALFFSYFNIFEISIKILRFLPVGKKIFKICGSQTEGISESKKNKFARNG